MFQAKHQAVFRILYLVGVGIKIMAATFIARVIYEGKLSEVTPDINAISP